MSFALQKLHFKVSYGRSLVSEVQIRQKADNAIYCNVSTKIFWKKTVYDLDK